MDQIKKGERYNQLKPSYVIFICTFDFYGLDQAIYSFENYDMRNSLPYGDNSYKIIVNTTCSEESTPPELKAFFDYINDMVCRRTTASLKPCTARWRTITHRIGGGS